MVDVDLLVPHPLNPNKHGERQIEMLAKIMNHQGWRHPITVSKRSGFIVAGHGRLMAAKKLGWTQAPVDRQEFDTEADEYAHLIADNKIAELAEHDDLKMFDDLKKFPDLDLDLLGIPDFELPMPEIVPGCDADDVPEALPEPKVVRGEVYILGNHRLMCGDSTAITDVERLMNGEKADMVFTDPPYGVAVVNTQGGILGDQDLTVFKDCLPLLKSFSKENSHTYIWCASGDMFPDSIAAFREVFQFQNILPIRCTHENKRGKKGAFKLNFETCLFANDNTKTFNPSKKFSVSETTLNDPRYKGDGKLRVYPALWDGERSTEHNMNIVHPTQKKVEMIEFYVEISSNENEILIDLFGGSGSTLIACEKTNRKCFMMELDPHYCAVILDRWQKFTGKKAHREDGVAWDEIRQ
jgi:DNA modification methylase